MATESDYEPSPWGWVRDQVGLYERTGGEHAPGHGHARHRSHDAREQDRQTAQVAAHAG